MEQDTTTSPPPVEGTGEATTADDARRRYFELIEALREAFDRDQWNAFLELRRASR